MAPEKQGREQGEANARFLVSGSLFNSALAEVNFM
jgi:hypothetical protein